LGRCECGARVAGCGSSRRCCAGGLGDRLAEPADGDDAHAAGDDAVGHAAAVTTPASASARDAAGSAAARNSSTLLDRVADSGRVFASCRLRPGRCADQIAVCAAGLEPARASGTDGGSPR
jgi:hypothetical protein